VNCPKCGFEQEERLDCRKCGVVFSKYLALQTEAAPAHLQGENGGSIEIQELRQSIRDISRRFSEVEFERVERGQIKGELKVLDKKFQTSSDQLSLRLAELEKLLSTPQAPPPIPDGERLAEVQKELVEANIDPLARRLGEIEEKLLRLEQDFVPPKESLTTEILGRIEARLTDLEVKVASLISARFGPGVPSASPDVQNRMQSLGDELAELRFSLERISGLQQDVSDLRSEASKIWIQIQEVESGLSRLPSPAAEPSPGERLEMDIRSIRDSLQEIREYITRVTAKS